MLQILGTTPGNGGEDTAGCVNWARCNLGNSAWRKTSGRCHLRGTPEYRRCTLSRKNKWSGEGSGARRLAESGTD